MNVNLVLAGYIDCALWATTNAEGDSLYPEYDGDDLAEETHAAMSQDVEDFLQGNAVDCEAWARAHEDPTAPHRWDSGAPQIGHDFWLTRNHHGTGFWDRHHGTTPEEVELAAIGKRLTAAAHAYGESDLYVGDDGQLYVT